MVSNCNPSEIINQKKQFIFEVTQTSNHVFPNEGYKYFVYIKNVSGVPIRNFRIKVENNKKIHFDDAEHEYEEICLDVDEVKLYELKAHCESMGEHHVHFIGYGEGTQIVYRTLKIRCDRVYNSDKYLHRFCVYDFTPYEENYTLEASDYNDDTTELFKVQKLPYKSGEQPYSPIYDKYYVCQDCGYVIDSLQRHIHADDPVNKCPECGSTRLSQEDRPIENIESQSFLDQYEEAKNTKEHVYQYIGRENFAEDADEVFEAKTMADLFDKINKNSKYFQAQFFRSGTNNLLNDFMQLSPNGFFYRMGLLNSEIFHNYGVLPTYSYMSDKLFRWAPGEDLPLDLIPQKQGMKWGEHVWAGKGWIIYRIPTVQYAATEEYAKKVRDNEITKNEVYIGIDDTKEVAEEMVKKLEEWDEIKRREENSDIIKYNYYLVESLYEVGVFFIHIPISKIPSNFYLMKHEDLMTLVNKTKPCGTKAIINYVVEETFNQEIDFVFEPNHIQKIDFEEQIEINLDYFYFVQNQFVIKKLECNGKTIEYKSFSPTFIKLMNIFHSAPEFELLVGPPQLRQRSLLELTAETEYEAVETKLDYSLNTIQELLELLYQNNYNNISFKLVGKDFSPFQKIPLTEQNNEFSKTKNENGHLCFKDHKQGFDALRFKTPNRSLFNKGEMSINLEIEDIYHNKHKISSRYNPDHGLDYITYSYTNIYDNEFIRKEGYEYVESINIIIEEVQDKKILIFMVEEKEEQGQPSVMHYFHHIIVQDILKFTPHTIDFKTNEKVLRYESVLYGLYLDSKNVVFETPFVKRSKKYSPKFLINDEASWKNIERINNDDDSYGYIKNLTNDYLYPGSFTLFYDDFNIPETAVIKKLSLKINGKESSSYNNIYVSTAYNVGYKTPNINGNKIQTEPGKIECYHHTRESNEYYQSKLNSAIRKGHKVFITKFSRLIDENIIFDEDIGTSISYLKEPNKYITINNQYWYELSEFDPALYNSLNEVESIKLVIEGYNTEAESTISIQTSYDTENSSEVTKSIPSGYFRKKIPLLYQNSYLLELLRVRFRFKSLNHDINIFDTRLEISFKNKQEEDIDYEEIGDINLRNRNILSLLENHTNIADDLNNGVSVHLDFDDLKPGGYYNINSIVLEVIYQETDIDMILTNKQYQDEFYGISKSLINGELSDDAYLSGGFYNDVETMSQHESNIGYENRGIQLKDSLYQMFETRDDNITGIEIFPHSFVGKPDEMIKIGLYENSFNTPGRLIKEIYADGWLKSNKQLKNLTSIKYNFNIEGLKIDTKYWFKIEVLNPEEASYYVLKGINQSRPNFKLLAEENNNYINTFSNLKFTIYSKNISKSFNSLPAIQEYFDNPYIMIGLHKGVGEIERLHVNKYEGHSAGDDYMGELFESNCKLEVFKIYEEIGEEKKEIPTTKEE